MDDRASSSPNQQLGTTSDKTDAVATENIILKEVDMSASMTQDMTTGYSQEIKDFLAKPIRIDDFTIERGRDLLRNYALHSYLHQAHSPKQIWWDKVKGYYGVRGTFVIRVQMNAQPFQAGRFMLVHEPMYYDMQYADGSSSAYRRTDNLITTTQLPRVEMDIGTQSEMTMRIPYRSLSSFYNILNGTGTWGRVTLLDYLPLNVGPTSSTKVDVTVWLSLEDVELAAPTVCDSYYEQMAAVDSEKTKGPIEEGLSKVTKVSTLFSGIPYMSTVAKPLSWVSRIGEQVCSVFGWSKPFSTGEISRVNRSMMQYQSNCEGLDNAFNLGLQIDNQVEHCPAFGGTYIDEMSLQYIKTRSAFSKIVTWESTQASAHVLANIELSPQRFQDTIDGITYLTPIAGLMNVFAYWRGSFKFKFKIAKTAYHSGRLLLAFVPGFPTNKIGTRSDPVNIQYNDTNFLHREIIDIREKFEFEYEVPYTAMVPFLHKDQHMGRLVVMVQNSLVAPDTAPQKIDMAIEVAGGEDMQFAYPSRPAYFPHHPNAIQKSVITTDFWSSVVLDQVNSLIIDGIVGAKWNVRYVTNFRESAGGLISALTFVRGKRLNIRPKSTLHMITTRATADDVLRHVPGGGLYSFGDHRFLLVEDIHGSILVQPVTLPDDEDNFFEEMDTGAQPLGATTIRKSVSTKEAKECVGEQILSMKQLTLRSVFHNMIKAEKYERGSMPIIQRPHLLYANKEVGTEPWLTDYYSYVGGCYAFSRGGVIMRYYGFTDKLIQIVHDDTRVLSDPFAKMNPFEGYVLEDADNLASAYIPQYAYTLGRLCVLARGNDTGAKRPFGQTVRVLYEGLAASDRREETPVRYTRSAADDTDFGFFLGFPPMSPTYVAD